MGNTTGAEHAGDDRGQFVRLQPSPQYLDHRNSILIWTPRRGQTIKRPTLCLTYPFHATPVHAARRLLVPALLNLQELSWNICKPRASICRGLGSAPFACRATSAARRSKARW